MFKRIDHVEIIPGDFAASLKFYQQVLDFKLVSRMDVDAGPLKEIVYLQLGDTVLELLNIENPVPISAEMMIGYRAMALEVESMAEATAYLRDRGVEVTWGPIDLGDSLRAEIADPDGLIIELRQWEANPWC